MMQCTLPILTVKRISVVRTEDKTWCGKVHYEYGSVEATFDTFTEAMAFCHKTVGKA